MKYTPLTLTTLTIITALTFATSGCGKKAETTANLNTTSDLEVLAGLGEGAGSAQNTVEIIPVPQGQAFQSGADATQAAMQQGIQQAGQIAATSIATAADVKPGTVEYSKKIQQALKNAGLYTGNVDGKIGPKTREAIKAFQTQNGLKADGVAGAQTWAKLGQYYTGTASAPAAASTTAE